MTRRWVIRILILIAAIGGVSYLWWQMNNQQLAIGLHHHTYYVSVMRTNDELVRGLSGTKSLPADHAMLFVFPKNYVPKMWMKDMNYPIDIVWLNDDHVVTYMVKNAQPSSYNATDPSKSAVFNPNGQFRYVIELPGGTIDKTGIVLGDPAGLPSGV